MENVRVGNPVWAWDEKRGNWFPGIVTAVDVGNQEVRVSRPALDRTYQIRRDKLRTRKW